MSGKPFLVELTAEELSALGVELRRRLRWDSYVEAGDLLFSPDDSEPN